MNPILSSGLLAASLALGQTAEPPIKSAVPSPPTLQPIQSVQSVQTTPQPMSQPKGPILGFFSREDRPILNKIQSWFKRDNTDSRKDIPNNFKGKEYREPPPLLTPPITPASNPGTNDFHRKMPSPSSQATTKTDSVAKSTGKEIQQTTLKQSTAKSPILPHLAKKIGRDEKFEWVTGQFEIEHGTPVLYYATPETIDKYNGRIVLQMQQSDLNQFRKGDLVSLRGQVSQSKIMQGSVPVYRVTSASLVERPKL